MTEPVRLACQREIIEVPLARILPMRRFDNGIHKAAKYRCIAASVREMGLIEPLVVFPQPDSGGCFMLLDGHVRLMILKELGVASAKCLVSADDEGFTYNHKVNRLSAIQEHFMILRAIKNGISEERIAQSLDVNVASIRQKRDLLDGICPEAVQLLKDRQTTGNALRELRKVRPMRQIEIAELMCAASNFSVGYAKCLVAATPADLAFRFDFLIEGRIDDALAVLPAGAAVTRTAVRRLADQLLPPEFLTVWVDEAGEPLTDADRLAVFAEPYRDKKAGDREHPPGSRHQGTGHFPGPGAGGAEAGQAAPSVAAWPALPLPAGDARQEMLHAHLPLRGRRE